jgi:hypothetical protein
MKTQIQKHDGKFLHRLSKMFKRFGGWLSEKWDDLIHWFKYKFDWLDVLLGFLYLILIACVAGLVIVIVLAIKDCSNRDNMVEPAQAKVITDERPPEINWDVDTVFVLPPINNGYVVTFKGKDNYTLKIEPYKVSGLIQNP